MSLLPSFVDLLQPLYCVMTAPSFQSFLTLITGWIYARRCTVTGMIVAAGAAVGHKHHSPYHRLFAARWSLNELGLAVLGLLILPLVPGVILLNLALDDTMTRKRGPKSGKSGPAAPTTLNRSVGDFEIEDRSRRSPDAGPLLAYCFQASETVLARELPAPSADQPTIVPAPGPMSAEHSSAYSNCIQHEQTSEYQCDNQHDQE